MNYEHEDTIELGVVSVDTRGLPVGSADSDSGQQIQTGLSDD